MPELFRNIAIITIALSIFVLIISLIKNIANDILNSAFPEEFENIKLFFGEAKHQFTTRIIAAGKVAFKGFYATVFVFEKSLIVKHLNRAIMVNDLSKLKLSGKFVSTLTIENGNAPIQLTLGITEYNIIKEFLEANNG